MKILQWRSSIRWSATTSNVRAPLILTRIELDLTLCTHPVNNISLAEPKPSSRAVSPSLLSPTDEKKLPNDSSNEDYVYDVFYFALKDINDVNELMAREAGSIATLFVWTI